MFPFLLTTPPKDFPNPVGMNAVMARNPAMLDLGIPVMVVIHASLETLVRAETSKRFAKLEILGTSIQLGKIDLAT